MEYGNIVRRSVNIVWQNKFLIILGFLASLGSGSSGGGGGGGGGSNNGSGDLGQITGIEEEFAALAVGVIVFLVCVLILVGLVLWAISTVARGGLIASVVSIESGEKSSFGAAWSAGMAKAWTLLGIGFLPAIPGIVSFVVGLMALGAYGGILALTGEEFDTLLGSTSLGLLIGLFACVVVPIVLLLSILRNFAERACMLEDLGVVDAYRRGWEVLFSNLGEAVLLFLLQVGIFILLALLLFLPGLVLVLCCCLWPLFMAVQGAISAAVSAAWTLAWQTWTGGSMKEEKATAAA